MKLKIKNKKAFTLIELLVIVLIIGILAAIALPQYRVSVAKAEYSTLKNMTKSIAEASTMFENSTGSKPLRATDLDISFTKATFSDNNGRHFYIQLPKIHCEVWVQGWDEARCCFNNDKMCYYHSWGTKKSGPYLCLTVINYEIGHRVCQHDTGKTREQGYSDSEAYLLYYY